MREWKRYLMLLAPLLAVALLVNLPGCEDEPDELSGVDEMFANDPFGEPRIPGELPLEVTPISASVSQVNDLVPFKVLGGVAPFSWSVGDRSRGYVKQSRLNSDTAIYVASVVAQNTILVFDSAGRAGAADIQAGAAGFQIVPASYTLSFPQVGQTIQFTALGGTPPYGTWTVAIPSLGTIDQTGLYTVQSSTQSGDNTITLTDSAGAVATAQVKHELDDETLTVVPSTATLEDNGDSAFFVASGGRAPYSWSIVYPGRGTITGISSDTTVMTYQRTAEGDQTVVVRDVTGATATTTITQADIAPLSVEPENVTLSSNELSVVLSAVGGQPPYVIWQVRSGPGSVSPNTGSETVYSRTAGQTGVAVVEVRDDNDTSAFASITLQ